jgi:hypothetical protein
MMAEAALQPDLHVVEHELRRARELVVPGHQRVADHDLALAEEPLAHLAVAGPGVDFESRDVQPAGRVAADRELGLVERELLQAQVQRDDRRPRDQHVDLGQQQHRRPLRVRAVADREALDRQPRIPPVPAAADRLDRDRLAELPRELPGDSAAVLFQAGEH